MRGQGIRHHRYSDCRGGFVVSAGVSNSSTRIFMVRRWGLVDLGFGTRRDEREGKSLGHREREEHSIEPHRHCKGIRPVRVPVADQGDQGQRLAWPET